MCPFADYCMVPVLIGWWTIIPLTITAIQTEYIASGICVHLQIINIAIQLNTLQVDMCPLADYCMFRFNRLVDNHPH